MSWLRLTFIIAIFVSSCMGLGYLADRWVHRHAWPVWAILPITVAIALIWPAILFAFAVYDARQYQPRSASDPADAPAMLLISVIFVGIPALFAFSVLFAMIGEWLSARKAEPQ